MCLNIKKTVFLQFFIFSAIGAMGTVAQYLILFFLVMMVKFNPVLASSIGFIVGALINYILNYKITFKSDKRHLEAASKFFTIAIVGFCLNASLMALLVEKVKLFYLIAQIIVTFIVLLWNFTGNKLWTFKV